MGKPIMGAIAMAGLLALGACADNGDASKAKDLDPTNVVDATDLNDIMLTVADPNEAVEYFRSSLTKEPKRIEFRRGLGKSLVRAKRATEAVPVFEKLVEMKGSIDQDRIDLADAMIRTNDWKGASEQLNKVPPTVETYQRYRLEAMIADSQKKWKKADSFYEIAAGLTTKPSNVMNNWGYSKMARGDYKGAEKLFVEAITYDRKLFTAKNNLVLARAAQKNYSLPVVPMTEEEKAQLMYTAGLSAVKQGDTDIGRGLLQDAIDTHPRHFEEAVRSLEALQRTIKS
ncbi:tetratricopeptide repeat protein [Amylibacter sp. IMCC11727]|uniref:tetratricopeptide repeat protein n=1 Tax=Amylibacter sp. IMCC11727 TaxID=3039851 RepID=UPI00244E28E2|nr:tetratricopeptide repeat protein [Amylibacter sp. IMCC11727]WGI22852.1 tetratricopeptide repeat protein [Amylibacter sp. IMCC11727]